MDAVKFLEEYNRMCNTYNDCVGCPMHDKPFCHPHDMTTNDERKELVDAVERWDCEHSIATNEMNDTVNRAMAINAIDRAVTKEAARWSLQELPSAESENIEKDIRAMCGECDAWNIYKNYLSADRPTGEWIGEADGYADGELVYDTWYCSNCGYVVDDDEPPTWNYCPNCGCYNGGGQND